MANVPTAAPGDGTTAATPAGSAAKVVWTLPENWKNVASAQAMRVATIDAGGVEVSVTAFPGAVGGTLANINRWRGQMGLDPVGEGDLAGLLRSSRHGGTEVSQLSMTGKDGRVMLAAIVVPGDGQTWFVKATTDAPKASAMRAVFEKFAESFRLGRATTTGAPAPATASPAPQPAPSPFAPNAPNPHAQPTGKVEARLAQWKPPAQWKIEPVDGGVLAAAFAASNAEGGARVTATSLVNDGGGPLSNINRWREQLSLAALSEFSQQPVSDVGPGTTLVDLTNPSGTDRMIAVIVPAEGMTWFFKLRGTPKGVEAERGGFEKFVKAVGLGVGP